MRIYRVDVEKPLMILKVDHFNFETFIPIIGYEKIPPTHISIIL